MFDLRLYQDFGLTEISRLFREGMRSVLLISPTGSGKTVVASHAIKLTISNDKLAMFVAHRKELVDQASSKLTSLKIPHAIIMAGYMEDWTAPVQIASVMTAIRRETPEEFHLILVDEAHHASAASYRKLLDRYPKAKILGLTATPFRSDGKGLGDLFDASVTLATVQELIDQDYLVQPRYWAPTLMDLAGVKKEGLGWDADEVTAVARKTHLVGDVVKHYLAIAPMERGVCFAPSVAFSKEIAQAFNDAGIPAAHLDDKSTKKERSNILRDLILGRILIVSNVGILTEGWDNPAVSVCIMTRPTQSRGLYLQMAGRVLRPCAGKMFAKIIDHVGNIRRLGYLTDPIEADLYTGLKGRTGDVGPALRTCPKCFAILPSGTSVCPLCEHGFEGCPPRTIIQKDGTLKELTVPVCRDCGSFDSEKKPHPEKGTGLYCKDCGRFLRWISEKMSAKEYYKRKFEECIRNNWKPGRAKILTQKRHGQWPKSDMTNEAEAEVLAKLEEEKNNPEGVILYE